MKWSEYNKCGIERKKDGRLILYTDHIKQRAKDMERVIEVLKSYGLGNEIILLIVEIYKEVG